MYDALLAGRSSSNLMGGKVDTTANYSGLTSLPVNAKLASIWNESEHGSIAELGHRFAFMSESSRDIGIGGVLGYYTWMAYGDSPEHNNGELLGSVAQKAIYDRWPKGPKLTGGLQTWPSHGYFPFFMLHGSNQAWSLDLFSGPTSKPTVSHPVKDEIITLKMEYFVHDKDGDLSTLASPVQTITLTDVMGVFNSGNGPVNPKTGTPDYVNAEMIPNGGTGPEFVQGGGYYFTTTGNGNDNDSSFPYKWRMPQDWYTAMSKDFNGVSPPRYHTVRTTISSNGDGFKVRRPFYMNPKVGDPLVIQTTFFDIKRQTGPN
ncbi:MAG: hypothetical protein RL571_2570 [Pseudomonadota bacterium]|jgi:hypothetical protein